MSGHPTSRRAILAGAAALPALAAPAALAATGPDPIFAAIERHKVTFRAEQEAGMVRFGIIDVRSRPDYDADAHWEADVRHRWARRRANRAGRALTAIRPTTIGGVVALICYVEAFNAGEFKHKGWSSCVTDWPPEIVGDDEMDMFGYMLLSNVRAALQAMAVQS